MGKFRKKPVVIDAMQYDGTMQSADAIELWSEGQVVTSGERAFNTLDLTVLTREGAMLCSPGDYVIRGVMGEYYPCKPHIFVATYDPVEG